MKKKLYTVIVEDSHNSPEELLLNAANESAVDYSSIYNWKNISVDPSSIAPKKIGNAILYFFDIYGDGDAQEFNIDDHIAASQTPLQTDFAAKEADL